MREVYLNRIATAVPVHDVHRKFISYMPRLLSGTQQSLFRRMAKRAQIDHRYSFLPPADTEDRLDEMGFYDPAEFPDTEKRMKFYQRHAFTLARQALDQIDMTGMTHLLVTTCTGFYAPGIDLQILRHYRLNSSVERTVIGFMGCYAALNALKLARHIVRSDPQARVVILNLELCTLHLKQAGDIGDMISFLIFSDGCAASIVSSKREGLELQSFHSLLLPDSSDQMTWEIGRLGFDMKLSGRVPATIAKSLPEHMPAILQGRHTDEIAWWAVHPGGRSILDSVRDGAALPEERLELSRDILRRFGNMSSASIMFVLDNIMKKQSAAGEGCAMAFGPGLVLESMRFATGGA